MLSQHQILLGMFICLKTKLNKGVYFNWFRKGPLKLYAWVRIPPRPPIRFQYMHPYGHSRRDKLECRFGCCAGKSHPKRNSRKIVDRANRKTARQLNYPNKELFYEYIVY